MLHDDEFKDRENKPASYLGFWLTPTADVLTVKGLRCINRKPVEFDEEPDDLVRLWNDPYLTDDHTSVRINHPGDTESASSLLFEHDSDASASHFPPSFDSFFPRDEYLINQSSITSNW